MEFWPHRRAKKIMPRVRNWPNVAEPSFLGLVAFKAGMTHVGLIDDSEAASKGSEVIKPVTVLEFPRVYIYGIRFYSRKDLYQQPTTDLYVKELATKLGMKKSDNYTEKLADVKKDIGKITEVCALAFLDPSNLGFGNKKIMRFELQVGGKNLEEKIGFVEQWLGKEVKVKDMINEGDYLDVKSISKGKGWAGVIKRYGVARLMRKATQKIRHTGTMGAWHPPKVLYTIPQAGHMGYNYRTDFNKRVLKVGSSNDANTINVKGGYLRYGNVSNDYLLLQGSIPGVAKRLVRVQKAIRNKSAVKKPQLTYISTQSKQGAS
ncbi:MAG: 50S ribosomal protein L3 [Candidatus Micrarchaeota archaeon]|nr:50S ribosomal protein L3 [Candidatus Micrarchaeota archaeon]MDE1847664.1 50S ribosomal protein L3 [Candidatus Micrarchaeota archaeon]MDE1864485.1 50S ribosomal protein L3 [Candidatus Micrarchaeota archaeon]